jgi:hypothetical protein
MAYYLHTEEQLARARAENLWALGSCERVRIFSSALIPPFWTIGSSNSTENTSQSIMIILDISSEFSKS